MVRWGFSCNFILGVYLTLPWPSLFTALLYSFSAWPGEASQESHSSMLGPRPRSLSLEISCQSPALPHFPANCELICILSQATLTPTSTKPLMTSYIIAVDDISADCFWTVRHYGILVKHFHVSQKNSVSAWDKWMRELFEAASNWCGGICGAASQCRA